MKKRFPDFLIVGAAKSGTTSLANYLAEHPDIYVPAVKELHFFAFAYNCPDYSTPHTLGNVLVTELSEYLEYFKDASKKERLGEASVTYLYSGLYNRTIENLKKYHPGWKKVKIIIILREPVERAFSQYITRLNQLEKLPFEEAIQEWETRKKKNWSIAYDYKGFSLYHDAVMGYINNFDSVRIYLYEDMKDRSEWLIKDIYDFLEVDSSFVPGSIGKRYNVSYAIKSRFHYNLYNLYCKAIKYNPVKPVMKLFPEPGKEKIHLWIKSRFFKKPRLDSSTKERVRKFFKEDIIKLQDLINRDLSHWLK